MKKLIFIIFISMVIAPLVFADAGSAKEISNVDSVIQTSMTDVLKVVKETSTTDKEKRSKLWAIVLRTFDFEKITEFALGKFSATSRSKLGEYGDRRFSKDQHAEFEKLFTQHLGNTYLDRLEFDSVDVKIDVATAIMLKPKKDMKRAKINTIINDKILIDYLMLNRNNQWRVYDLKVEGRSLVSAFRKEYKSVLLKNKPDYLIDLIKGKIAAHAKKEESKAKSEK